MKKTLYLLPVLFIFIAIGFAGNSQKVANAQLADTASKEVFYFVYNLTEGWNFVSPVNQEMAGKSISEYFPNVNAVYYFDNNYQAAKTFEIGRGYWLKNNVAESIKVSGTPITSVDYKLYGDGQHLVGAPFTMSMQGVDCIEGVRHYNNDTSSYFLDWTIEQGSSAWLDINGDCAFTRPGVKPVPSIGPIPTVTDPAPTVKDPAPTVTDPAPIIKPAPTTPISITMPTSKEIWRQGETHTIRWDAGDYANYMRYVKLMYNDTPITISNDAVTLANGEFSWTINLPTELLNLITDKPVKIRVGVQPETVGVYAESAPFIIKKSLSSIGPIPTATDPAPVITPDPGLVGPIFIYNLTEGWNFVSAVTEEMAGQAIVKYFPNTEVVHYFDIQYKEATNFTVGQGYWLKNIKTETIKVSGTPITAHKYNFTNAGWYLVGAPFTMSMQGVDCVVDVQHFNNDTASYYTDWTIEKGSAAWVETKPNCSFARPGSGQVVHPISVLAPTNGEIWRQGETHTIKWDAGDYANGMRYVSLIYNDIPIHINYDAVTLASGEFNWTINLSTELLNLIADQPVRIRVGGQPETTGPYANSAPFIIKKSLSDIGPVPIVTDNKLSSPNIFALGGQKDSEGPVNYDIYASFNRVITGSRTGTGVEKVKVSLYFPTAAASPIAVADSCEINLLNNSNTCQDLSAVSLTNGVAKNQALVKIKFNEKHYESLKFDVTYSGTSDPTGFTVDIGDSVSNDAWGGDAGTQSNDSEIQIYNTHLSVFGDDNTVGERRLSNLGYYVKAGDTVSITLRNNYVEWSRVKGQNALTDPVFIVPTVSTSRVTETNITEIKDRAKLLHDGRIENILTELKVVQDMVKEQETEIKYLRALTASVAQVNEEMRTRLNQFITYGVDDNTLLLGAGERAAVVNSYKEAFGKLPETEADLEDIIKISNGRWPGLKSQTAEDKAAANFKQIYLRDANPNNPNDKAAIVIMAYGLRQQARNRNLSSEAQALATFDYVYGHMPANTQEWNNLQAITYSGAEREPVDTDKDGLSDKMETHYKTDPNNPDTDGDSYPDGIEVVNGHSPL